MEPNEAGAVLIEDCQTGMRRKTGWDCRCEPLCGVCGNRKHTAIHGPFAATPTRGSKPYGHEFKGKLITQEETKTNG
jgi:hypothetical protein